MPRTRQEIYKETREKEDRHPELANDLAVKRAEGQHYERSIISSFNFLSQRHKLIANHPIDDKINEEFFTTYDASLFTLKDELVTDQVELKGRPQWVDREFPYESIIINTTKLEKASEKSLVIYCDQRAARFMSFWNLRKAKQYSSRPFQLRSRGALQINRVTDLPVKEMMGGMLPLVNFFDKGGYKNA